MTASATARETDWLGACRRATARLETLLAGRQAGERRAEETGTRGAGGDRTLVLDSDFEAIVFAELETLHGQGARFTAISEEHGERAFGGGPLRVVIDPIDGSTNATRGALHYALSVAVADGDTMADVTFGFVHDFGSGEQWWAWRGEGAWRSSPLGPAGGERLDPSLSERRSHDGRLELVGIEASDPRRVKTSIDGLLEVVYRIRALGTIAVSLCQVAAARYDGMLTLRRARGVDAAAAQLIVREAGGLVAFPECPSPLAAPLDATASSPVIAARSAAGLRELEDALR